MSVRGGRGGGRGGMGGGSFGPGAGRGRGEIISAPSPALYPDRGGVRESQLIVTEELSSLVDTSHVLDSTVKRSIFYLEKARPRPDIERYSDRYMKQSEKPPIRSLIEGDAWQGYPDELKLTAGKRGAGGASHAGVGVSGTKSKRVKAEPHKASAGAGGGARKGQNGKTTAPVVSVKDMKDIFASLEKLATGTDLDADDKDGEEGDKEKKAGSDAEAEEEKEVEEEEEEDMDDYVQNYYDDEYDALGSDSGGDDY